MVKMQKSDFMYLLSYKDKLRPGSVKNIGDFLF